MGFLNRSVSFSRFKTSKKVSYGTENLRERIKKNAFREVEENSEEEISIGWVALNDWIDNKFEETSSFLKASFISLSLRVDKRKVPKQAIYTQYRKRLAERYTEEEQRLTKEDRENIKEAVTARLLRRAIPTTQIYDMIWNTHTNEVFFTSTSEKLCLTFFEIFNKTFDCTLIQIFPYSMAEEHVSSLALKQLSSTNFVHGTFSNVEHSDNRAELPIIKRFLGQEFLTWLWYMSDTCENERLAIYRKKEAESIEAFIGDKITLETLTEEDNEKIMCHGQTSEMLEAFKAISQGKKITSMDFNIIIEDRDYVVTLDDKWLNFKTCKTPKISLNKEDMDGAFFEKIYLINELTAIVNNLFETFIKERVSGLWATRIRSIVLWLNK